MREARYIAVKRQLRRWQALSAVLAVGLCIATCKAAGEQEIKAVSIPPEEPSASHTAVFEQIRTIPEPEPEEQPEQVEQAYDLIVENATVTHYDTCLACCGKTDGITASGRKAVPGYTIAVDPALIELGSIVYVDYGDGKLHEYRADDVGGAITGAHIDVCVSDHQTALELGVRTATLYVRSEEH